jgi:predicted N-formylglutamate amidohydrolase
MVGHALVETGQEMIGSKSGVHEWAEHLAPVLERAMNDPI